MKNKKKKGSNKMESKIETFYMIGIVIALAIIVIILNGCAGISVVEVCNSTKCATGFYNENGSITTSGHPFTKNEDVNISANNRYTDTGIVKYKNGIDSVVVIPKNRYYNFAKKCSVSIGDIVTINTLYGPVRRRVTDVVAGGLSVSGSLRNGDSGSPVTRRGCIVGVVRANSGSRVLVTEIEE